MTDKQAKDPLPTREQLEREARRLARIRHLRVVDDETPEPVSAHRPVPVFVPDHDPRPAA